RDLYVTGVQTCALPIWIGAALSWARRPFGRSSASSSPAFPAHARRTIARTAVSPKRVPRRSELADDGVVLSFFPISDARLRCARDRKSVVQGKGLHVGE